MGRLSLAPTLNRRPAKPPLCADCHKAWAEYPVWQGLRRDIYVCWECLRKRKAGRA